ncbi:uncharacterized protein VTP21DRAFT_651 [Calcarisporiella thermophila]|uniref:uncharacterized protein n=1 Tax=Calcarisporiella thermophila TaxID=911321 RepID=UPI003744B0D5
MFNFTFPVNVRSLPLHCTKEAVSQPLRGREKMNTRGWDTQALIPPEQFENSLLRPKSQPHLNQSNLRPHRDHNASSTVQDPSTESSDSRINQKNKHRPKESKRSDSDELLHQRQSSAREQSKRRQDQSNENHHSQQADASLQHRTSSILSSLKQQTVEACEVERVKRARLEYCAETQDDNQAIEHDMHLETQELPILSPQSHTIPLAFNPAPISIPIPPFPPMQHPLPTDIVPVSAQQRQRKQSKIHRGEIATLTSDLSASDESDEDIGISEKLEDNPWKLHGELHDLMMKLERQRAKHQAYQNKAKIYAKKVQTTIETAERKLRFLLQIGSSSLYGANISATTPPTTTTTAMVISPPMEGNIPPMPHLNGNGVHEHASTQSGRWAAQSSTSVPILTPPLRELPEGATANQSSKSGTLAEKPRQNEHPSPKKPRAGSSSSNSFSAPSSSSTTTTTAVTSSASSSRKAPNSLRSPSESSSAKPRECSSKDGESVDILVGVTKTSLKAFKRKPRTLLFNNAREGDLSDMSDLMVTSSLDGEILFWNARTRKTIDSIPPAKFNFAWPEDMCWINEDTLAVAAASGRNPFGEEQVNLIQVRPQGSHRVQYRLQRLKYPAHERGISVIAPIERVGDRTLFATGGLDKIVMVWEVQQSHSGDWSRERGEKEGGANILGVRSVLSRHTSAVHSLAYDSRHKWLISGGADCRLFITDMERKTRIYDNKFAERINHTLLNPANPNLVLLNFSSKQQQFRLLDTRSPERSIFSAGIDEPENLSRYISPCWHPAGNIFSCGSNAAGRIGLWDIRCSRSPLQTLSWHEKRVLKAMFLPDGHSIVSVSTDLTACFGHFQLASTKL